ncbi:MAG TPA: hypothetical protein PLW93_05650 [Candidatus Absconditabacterales bacterium]|nr:hypothetical protein [Candidatus Absconditabacterales bacterium]
MPLTITEFLEYALTNDDTRNILRMMSNEEKQPAIDALISEIDNGNGKYSVGNSYNTNYASSLFGSSGGRLTGPDIDISDTIPVSSSTAIYVLKSINSDYSIHVTVRIDYTSTSIFSAVSLDISGTIRLPKLIPNAFTADFYYTGHYSSSNITQSAKGQISLKCSTGQIITGVNPNSYNAPILSLDDSTFDNIRQKLYSNLTQHLT